MYFYVQYLALSTPHRSYVEQYGPCVCVWFIVHEGQNQISM